MCVYNFILNLWSNVRRESSLAKSCKPCLHEHLKLPDTASYSYLSSQADCPIMDSHFLGRYFAQKQHPGMEEGCATFVQENGVNGHVNGNGVKDHLSGDTHTKTYHNGNADYRNPADKTDKRVLAAAPQIPTFDDRGPFLSGFQRPTKFEGQIEYLEVYGEIPKSLSGTFYRIMPDPMFPSSVYNDQVCPRVLLLVWIELIWKHPSGLTVMGT